MVYLWRVSSLTASTLLNRGYNFKSKGISIEVANPGDQVKFCVAHMSHRANSLSNFGQVSLADEPYKWHVHHKVSFRFRSF